MGHVRDLKAAAAEAQRRFFAGEITQEERAASQREYDKAVQAARVQKQRAAAAEQLLLDKEEAAAAAGWLIPRLRKTVSREPGFSVYRLGDRCLGVIAYYGAPVRTCFVVMASPDTDMTHTSPLHAEDLQYIDTMCLNPDTRDHDNWRVCRSLYEAAMSKAAVSSPTS